MPQKMDGRLSVGVRHDLGGAICRRWTLKNGGRWEIDSTNSWTWEVETYILKFGTPM